MKINLNDLKIHLKKKLSPCYLLSSDEIFLKQDAIRLIRKAAESAGYNERTRFVLDTGFDWQAFHGFLMTPSMFAEKRYIEVDARQTLPNKAGSDILIQYAASPSQDIVLVFDIKKLDAKLTKSAWYQSLDKLGTSIPIWPISREELPRWIIQRANIYKININAQAANMLADYVEGNMAAAAQAIEKIYLSKYKSEIDEKAIGIILSDESQFTIFDFIDALIGGKQSKALQILNHLQAEGTEATLVLWAITREIRMLTDMANELQQGQTHDSIFKKYRVFAKRQSILRSFLSRKNTRDCLHLMSHAADIDRIIKGALAGNVWENFQLFCLRLF